MSDEARIELKSASHAPSSGEEINFAEISQFQCVEAQDCARPSRARHASGFTEIVTLLARGFDTS